MLKNRIFFRANELQKKLKALAYEYDDIGLFFVINPDNTTEYLVGGSDCPVCIMTLLAIMHQRGELEHNKSTTEHIEDLAMYTKH